MNTGFFTAFYLAAATAALCAATVVAAVTATIVAIATAADENEKDDNPAAVTTAKEAVTHLVLPPFLFTIHTITLSLYRLQMNLNYVDITFLFVYERLIVTNNASVNCAK